MRKSMWNGGGVCPGHPELVRYCGVMALKGEDEEAGFWGSKKKNTKQEKDGTSVIGLQPLGDRENLVP